jgi:hypothetical protein
LTPGSWNLDIIETAREGVAERFLVVVLVGIVLFLGTGVGVGIGVGGEDMVNGGT